MPLYEYVCPDCESKFEELRPLSRMDDPANCPQGHPAGRRVLSDVRDYDEGCRRR